MAARFLSAPILRLLAPALIITLFSLSASAAEPTDSGDILWLVDGTDREFQQQVLAGVGEALSADTEGHLLGDDAFFSRVVEGDGTLPPCVTGVESCPPASTMAFDLLELALVIHLDVITTDPRVEINYEMVDRRGEIATTGVIQADSARQAGFEAVGQLFDAVGVVSFDSEPGGARVYVNGEAVGTTPLSRQFGVGRYDYRVEYEAYEAATGSVEVQSGGAHRVSVELEERPGRLRVHGAPAQAMVYIDDEPYGRSSEVMDLPAGQHSIEVRADGFQTYRATATIEAGMLTEVEAEMSPMPAILREMEASELAANRFQLDLGLQGGAQSAVFHGAGGTLHGEGLRFQGWLEQGELVDGGQARAVLWSGGLRLSANYEGQRWGLGLLSLSYSTHSANLPVQLSFLDGADTFDATMRSLTSLQIRPMQIRYRTFYENLAPFAQAGLGVAFHWMRFHSDEFGPVTMRQADAFAALEVGTRYHFDARWSLGASYRLQAYFSESMGAEHLFGLTVGFGFRDLPWSEPQPPEQL